MPDCLRRRDGFQNRTGRNAQIACQTVSALNKGSFCGLTLACDEQKTQDDNCGEQRGADQIKHGPPHLYERCDVGGVSLVGPAPEPRDEFTSNYAGRTRRPESFEQATQLRSWAETCRLARGRLRRCVEQS